jgi:hypothetical protein
MAPNQENPYGAEPIPGVDPRADENLLRQSLA